MKMIVITNLKEEEEEEAKGKHPVVKRCGQKCFWINVIAVLLILKSNQPEMIVH